MSSRVIGIELENSRLSESLDGIRGVVEVAEDVNSRIQRVLGNTGARVGSQRMPLKNSPMVVIQRLLHNVYTSWLLLLINAFSRVAMIHHVFF